MPNPFFDQPILNSPYAYPNQHWELDLSGQPTQKTIPSRRPAEFITPIPKPKKRSASKDQQNDLTFDEGHGLSSKTQSYETTATINQVRRLVDLWRQIPNSAQWNVTPETARLLQHWRNHEFSGVRLFFCQIEAVLRTSPLCGPPSPHVESPRTVPEFK
jgi:type III restriction enzyme